MVAKIQTGNPAVDREAGYSCVDKDYAINSLCVG